MVVLAPLFHLASCCRKQVLPLFLSAAVQLFILGLFYDLTKRSHLGKNIKDIIKAALRHASMPNTTYICP